MRRPVAFLLVAVPALALAGCFSAPGGGALVLAGAGGGVTIVGADGTPLPFAAVTVLGAAGPLATLSADATGTIDLALLPSTATAVVVAASGHAVERVPTPLPAVIALDALGAPISRDDAEPVLRFLEPLDLGMGPIAGRTETCAVYFCGLSEPVIEVAGDGSIYLSATCCPFEAPPVLASRDGGATFAPLKSAYREAIGVEGDFAVDDAGNVYFTDILGTLGSVLWFTSWDASGTERWTLPVPFPVVDRPWVRAGAENVVYVAYATVDSPGNYKTVFHRSNDGGRTWEGPLLRAGFGWGTLGQGPENEHLYIAGYVDGKPMLHESTDGGSTWSDAEDVPVPATDGSLRGRFTPAALRILGDFVVPVADEAGNLWVVYAWGEEAAYQVYATRRDPAGTWHGPFQVSTGTTHALPWPAALKDGTLAIAWYGAPYANLTERSAGLSPFPNEAFDVQDEDAWYLMAAVTVDGNAASPSFQTVIADPDPVLYGPLGGFLLDFLQIDISPDGALHIGYAAATEDGDKAHLRYVRSTTGLQLQPATFPFGPSDKAGSGARGLLTLR